MDLFDIPFEDEPSEREARPRIPQRRIYTVSELTGGKSLQANLSLLLNNARLAAQIASAYRMTEKRRQI